MGRFGGRALQALDRGRFWLRLVGVGVEQWSGNAGSSPERCSGKRRVPPSSSQLDFSRDALDCKPPSVLWFSKRKSRNSLNRDSTVEPLFILSHLLGYNIL